MSLLMRYYIGIIVTTIIMVAIYGLTFAIIDMLNVATVTGLMILLLIFWGFQTYYLFKMVDVEEKGV